MNCTVTVGVSYLEIAKEGLEVFQNRLCPNQLRRRGKKERLSPAQDELNCIERPLATRCQSDNRF